MLFTLTSDEGLPIRGNLDVPEHPRALEELLRRLPDVEHSGPVERLRSNFIGGIKHMPVRYTATRA